jgi:hypothetical protein
MLLLSSTCFVVAVMKHVLIVKIFVVAQYFVFMQQSVLLSLLSAGLFCVDPKISCKQYVVKMFVCCVRRAHIVKQLGVIQHDVKVYC